MLLYLYKLDDIIYNEQLYMRQYILTRFLNLPKYYSLVKTYDTNKYSEFDSNKECSIEIWHDDYTAIMYVRRDMLQINTNNLIFYWNYDEIEDEYFKCYECEKIFEEPNKQSMCFICKQLLCDECKINDNDKYICFVCKN